MGGAFNPPHIGHLVLAHEAACQLDLERVVLMPTGEAPHKAIDPEPGAEVRLEMARRAAAEDELLEVSDLEVRDPGPSYTFRTLERLSEERPGVIHFLMGADVAAHLDSWKRPERVLELAFLGIAGRPGAPVDDAEAAIERFGAADRVAWIGMPEIGVSSTWLRQRVAQRQPLRYLMPDPVIDLIESEGLYREAVTA